MNPAEHINKHCQDGANCTGGGCRVSTGKTKRKANWNRPKPNKHEAFRVSAATTSKKGR